MTPVPMAARAENPLAVWGFSCALTGPCFVGLTGLIGGVLCAFAVRRQPRRLAIAGMIIGFGQLLVIVPLAILAVGFVRDEASYRATMRSASQLQSRIAARGASASGQPRSTEELNQLAAVPDYWGTPLRITAGAAGQALPEIVSAGADKVFDTNDDFFLPAVDLMDPTLLQPLPNAP